MTKAVLRDYQTDAIAKLRKSLSAGRKRPVVQMPTGAGKTIAAAEIVRMARAKGNRVLFCVPSISLIDQTVEKFERHDIWEIGVIQAMHERTDASQPVQVLRNVVQQRGMERRSGCGFDGHTLGQGHGALV